MSDLKKAGLGGSTGGVVGELHAYLSGYGSREPTGVYVDIYRGSGFPGTSDRGFSEIPPMDEGQARDYAMSLNTTPGRLFNYDIKEIPASARVKGFVVVPVESVTDELSEGLINESTYSRWQKLIK